MCESVALKEMIFIALLALMSLILPLTYTIIIKKTKANSETFKNYTEISKPALETESKLT